MTAAAIFKAVVFFAILGVMIFVSFKVRKYGVAAFHALKEHPLLGRFFGNRSIDTQTEGRIFELTKVSVPDYVLLWIWIPAFLRIYLWHGIEWIVSTIDFRLSQLPIDPWNRAGIIPKTMLEETDKVLRAIDGFFTIWSGFPFVVAGILGLYVIIRFFSVVYIQPTRTLGTMVIVFLTVTAVSYVVGFILGGAFAGLHRLGADVEMIHLVTPWRLPTWIGNKFLEFPVRMSIWTSFWWWLTMYVNSSIWSRHRYVPASKQLRLLSWEGTCETVLNSVPKPKRILSVVSSDGETQPVSGTEEKPVISTADGDAIDNKRIVSIRWDYCGTLHWIFLFGGMRFRDELTSGKETPVVDVRGFPGLWFMVRRFARFNTVPAADKLPAAAGQPAKKSRPVRAVAGKIGRGMGSGAKGVARYIAYGRKPKTTAAAAAIVKPVEAVVSAPASVASVAPVAKQA